MYTQFFIPMQPPTTTHNAKQLHAYMKGGQPHAVLHDSPELKAARAKLHAYLAPHAPKAPIPAGQVVLPHRGQAPQRRVAHQQTRHRQPGKGSQGRDDPPALLGG